MSSRSELDRLGAELTAAREGFVLATVVWAERPTSAKPGDRALVRSDGLIEGFVGGSCAESTVRAQALEALASGESRLVRIVPVDPADSAPRPGEVTVANPCLSGGSLELFLEPRLPRPFVVVLGEGPVARALEEVGSSLDYDLLRVPALPDAADAADATRGADAVVVATHGRDEERAIEAARHAGVAYVGLVASRRRGLAVLDALELDDEARARVHTPAGLDLGGRTPGEVALSILAEIVSLRHSSRSARRAASGSTIPAAGESGLALDPVCGMKVAMVPASLHLEVGGETWWFCGSGCRDAYADDPARYRT